MTIRNALILAAFIVTFSLSATYAENAGLIGDETAKRAVQVVMGLVVVYFANLVPKTLEPRTLGCTRSETQAVQRFCGWSLVLAGLGYSLAWLVVPIEYASTTAMVILGAGVALVAVRCGLAFKKRGTTPSAKSG